MIIRRIYQDQLAQASYLIGCPRAGQGLVIDPNRDIGQYIEMAAREGLRIVAAAETHIHADFVSGMRELAAATGATMYLSDEGPDEWKYAFADAESAVRLYGGDTFMVGNIQIDVIHTPGHTPEHLCFLITDTAVASEPMGIFTGDFVFVSDVGRPDLLEKSAGLTGTAERAARQLFRSIQRFRSLPEYLQIWPGHGAGSACGRAMSAIPQSTVGYEKRFNWAFGITDEDQFVQSVLEGQPAPPPYFADMKRVNKLGPHLLSELPPVEQLDIQQLDSALAEEIFIVDTRPTEVYRRGHIAGTLNLPLGSAFLTWAGWLVHQPFALIIDQADLLSATNQLRLIGLDNLIGFWSPDILTTWDTQAHPLDQITHLHSEQVRQLAERGGILLVDVRDPHEYAAGHIAGSRNISLRSLRHQVADLPTDQRVVVYCQSGRRSAIAASLLSKDRRGLVSDMPEGFNGWQSAGHPIER